jgi:cytochrome c-type biogenesis protein CcmF
MIKDGSGLNQLLQNYWMVIHPPILFLGFASTIVPFSFAIAGLWKKDFGGWTKIALPWSLFSAAILGTGIMLGAIWAYESLNLWWLLGVGPG